MPSSRNLIAFALVGALGSAAPVWAIEDLVTPRSLGMGNSLRADASGALGPLLNPGSMALTHTYTLEVMYGFRTPDTGSTIHLSIVDSVTSRLAAGVYYSYVHGTPRFALDPGGPVQGTRDG